MEDQVFEQLEEIRSSGVTNMFNRNRVQREAYEREFFSLVTAIEDNEYTDLLNEFSDWKE